MRLLLLLWCGILPGGVRLRAVLGGMLCLLGALHPGPAQACRATVLEPGRGPVDLWAHLCMRSDPTLARTVQEMLATPTEFAAPVTRGGSLGVRPDAVWLKATLVPQARAGPWVINVDFPLLNELDVYLVADGEVLQHHALGNLQQPSPHALDWRTPAVVLALEHERTYELLVRVRTLGGMIVPLRIGTWRDMAAPMLREQMLQGLFVGLALCLFIYGLLQAVALREKVFAYYALLVLGSAGFSIHFFGIGTLFIWGHHPWMQQHAGPLFVCIAVIGAFLFMGHSLARDNRPGRFLRTMQGGAALSILLCAAFLSNVLNTPATLATLALLGPLPALISLPVAARRMHENAPVRHTLLLAWLVYIGTAVALALLVHGVLPARFWPMHLFQIAAVVNMLLFMRMLGLRHARLRDAVQDASRERDALMSLARTDPLTGLPNRRGLDAALGAALPHAQADRLLAVFMLDLDGFKPVNDQHGHAVGDRLLVAVAQRLRAHLRHADLIARLGGDEFVVMAQQLPSVMQAHDLGIALLESFLTPFYVQGVEIRVGLTIGYALAPDDACDAGTLIRLADAAMYSGKQQGKFCVRRNKGDLALASS